MKKKGSGILLLVLSLLLIMALAACGNTATETTAPQTTAQMEATTTAAPCAAGHSYGAWTETTAPTCTEKGEETKTCSVCGDEQKRDVSAKGHTEVTDAAVAPTCTDTGLTEGKHCSVCSEVLTAQMVISASGHSYGAWTETTAPTCTEKGEETKTCSVCGDAQKRDVSVKGHSYGEWIVDKKATCAQEGSRHSVCSVCKHEKEESIPKSSVHSYNEGTVTKSPTCTTIGSKTFTCSVCGKTKTEEISALGHSTDNTGKCTKCGLVTLNMTNTEIEKSQKIKKMSHWVSEYSDEIYINITLMDDNSYSVQVPVYVNVKIVDDNGNILYSETIIKKSSQSKVVIDYDKITNAFTNTGTLYYTVYNDYVYFDTISTELERLPWTVTIELPNVPVTISYTGYSASSCKVTGITYEVSGDNVTFYFTGEKTYDKNGSNYSQSCEIGWKLYDPDGYVVYDGICYTPSVKVGEKFKNADTTAYDVIEQGKTYRLVIMDIS